MALSVLIVDDSRVSRQIIRRSLPPWDLDVREVSGGQECLASYHENKADIVLLDLTMPGMDGFETLQRLKALDAGARVIIITADIQAGSEKRVLELGGQALLHKPVQSDALQAAMEADLP